MPTKTEFFIIQYTVLYYALGWPTSFISSCGGMYVSHSEPLIRALATLGACPSPSLQSECYASELVHCMKTQGPTDYEAFCMAHHTPVCGGSSMPL